MALHDYAAQLFKNIQQPFINAVVGFNDVLQRKKLDDALSVQAEIDILDKRIKKLKKQMSAKPEGITPEQLTLLEGALSAKKRHIRAVKYLTDLQDKQDKLLEKYNSDHKDKQFTEDQFTYVEQALALYKTDVASISISKRFY